MQLPVRAAFFALLALVAASTAAQQPAEETDQRHYARDRLADIREVEAELTLATMADFRLEAIQRLTFEPLVDDLRRWTLDAVNLDVRGVTMDGRTVDYVSDGETLTLYFERDLSPGREREVMIRYRIERPSAGLAWRPPTRHAAGEIHTDEATRGARHWLALFDEPGERFRFSLQADVPARFDVVSVGRRVDDQPRGERRLVEWRQDEPITADQLILAITADDARSSDWRALPLTLHGNLPADADAAHLFEALSGMIAFYEEVAGARYPWDGLRLVAADLATADLRSGAGVIEVHRPLLREWLEAGEGFDAQPLAEAVAQQWAGALLTPVDWSDVWVTRGLARYLSCLWLEEARGENDFTAEMLRMAEALRAVRADERTLPLVHRRWTDPKDLLTQPVNPTRQGAWVYHMLRRRLGDDAFRAALRDLFDEHLERGVDTDDVRDAMRAHTGRSLDRLFAYYVEQPGLPHLAFQVGWSDDAGELTIGVSQGGAATPDAPAAYRLDVPVLIQIGEEVQQRTLTVSDRQSVTRLPLPALPDVVAIDPHMSLLLAREDDRARLLWRGQLATGPTIFSRYLAARELAAGADHRTKELLAQAAADAGMATLVRRGAVQALAEIEDLQSHELLVDLAQQGLEPASLRLELVERISRIAEDEVEELLALHAAADPNPHVAAAAAHFLGLRQARQYADLLRQILADAELAPRVRRAALGALARLDDGGTLPLVLELARPDAADVRTRAAAARVAGVLGYRQPEATFEMLVTRLEEPIPLVQAAALTGLAELGDERALQEVEYFRNATRDPLTRHAAQQSFAKLQARFADNRSEAQQRIDFLEQRIRELEAEVQRLRQELTAERRNDEN